MTQADSQSGAQRLVEAAIQLFGKHGAKGTSLKAVATEAGVSPALIVHHFGSKDGLQRACDDHVLRVIRENKRATIAQGPQLDPFVALGQMERSRPVLRYLARTLTEGGSHVAELIDEMIADAEDYMAAAEEAGFIKPSATPRERVIVLVIWSLSALALHEHVHRLLGVDFLDAAAQPQSLAPYMRPIIELYTQGLTENGAFDELNQVFDSGAEGTGGDGA
ncbi:TetR family transcriptional regulator [Nocardioides massiliensis]|uniref:AcrR family transcriptional regulator n=1 Tax=Nocardioides massiliensis TaxID=1325935 RepID=A0ABT9NSK5_9ACTN|nr:TetR family transcriptional regulator [Nocardioides massiliensis]MDP9823406.1 AcrR family transcriptional regulator [Nocardioides massiliensis]